MNPDEDARPWRGRLIAACRTAFGLAATIALIAALIPAEDHPPELFGWDKADHFAAFAGLMLLGATGFPRRRLWVVGLGLVLYGAAIEILQALPFIHRDSEAADVLADAIGVMGAAAPSLLLRRLGRLRPPGE